jgi:two-component system, NarL family, nitrate/nitrite response regulator NarL
MKKNKTRIVLIDDHPLFREGVAYTLQSEPTFEVVGQGANLDEAVQLVTDSTPDILLLDINIPGGGIHTAEKITASHPMIKIIMLTASSDDDDLVKALKAGARGYILKGVAARELISIVRAVQAGEGYITPSLAATLLHEMAAGLRPAKPVASPLDELTKREREILEQIAVGLSNKEIGQRLHVSEKTVKHYVTSVLQKLHVRNRVEAALVVQKSQQAGK